MTFQAADHRSAGDGRPRPTARRATAVAVATVVLAFLAACTTTNPPHADVQPVETTRPADDGRVRPGATATYPAREREAAPRLDGDLLDGTTFDPRTLDGKVVVVNFWASWCAPCRAEAGDLAAAYEATREQGVEFVGVNVRDGRDQARSFVEGRESYPSLYDPQGRVTLRFADVSPTTLPATVIIDRQQRVAVVLRTVVTRAQLQPLIQDVATEARGAG